MRDFHIQKTTAVRQTALLSLRTFRRRLPPRIATQTVGVSVKPPVAKRHRLFYALSGPVTVDLAARFNWFLSRKVTLFAEGRNLCDAKLYDWAYYRDYGVGFTAGVKLQF